MPKPKRNPDRDVIAYRIIGVSLGWTDNPKVAE